MKKLIALTLATVMLLALCACGGGNGSNSVATLDPLTKDDVITMTIISHASWPYNENWKVWEYIREGSGATVEVNAIPSSDIGTKFPIMFAAPDVLTDTVTFDGKTAADKYCLQGALIALDDMEEYMPNYNAWLNSLSEAEYENNIQTRKAYDGKIYYAPVIGRESSQNVRAWLYRKDIFEKHNLKVPTTFDELYEVCKELKALYPDSYPYCLRSKFNNLTVSGSSWQPYWAAGIYYDYNNEVWKYGPLEDVTLEILEFYKKMVEEKLMPSDFMTMNNSTWQELITTDRGFIMPEYQTRIDFFNNITRENNPDFDLHAMVPPVATEQGIPMVSKNNIDPYGIVLANTRDEKRIANAAKLLDWFYTDEAMELVSWGKEGETFEIVDGKKQYIVEDETLQVNSLYGFSTSGSFLRIDPEAIEALESADIAETRDMVKEHMLPYANPTGTLALNDEEDKIRAEYATAITTYTNEMLTKFIIGQEPLSKFDEFRDTLRDMGIETLLTAYESAYNRIK